jgi:hypothetical protein
VPEGRDLYTSGASHSADHTADADHDEEEIDDIVAAATAAAQIGAAAAAAAGSSSSSNRPSTAGPGHKKRKSKLKGKLMRGLGLKQGHASSGSGDSGAVSSASSSSKYQYQHHRGALSHPDFPQHRLSGSSSGAADGTDADAATGNGTAAAGASEEGTSNTSVVSTPSPAARGSSSIARGRARTDAAAARASVLLGSADSSHSDHDCCDDDGCDAHDDVSSDGESPCDDVADAYTTSTTASAGDAMLTDSLHKEQQQQQQQQQRVHGSSKSAVARSSGLGGSSHTRSSWVQPQDIAAAAAAGGTAAAAPLHRTIDIDEVIKETLLLSSVTPPHAHSRSLGASKLSVADMYLNNSSTSSNTNNNRYSVRSVDSEALSAAGGPSSSVFNSNSSRRWSARAGFLPASPSLQQKQQQQYDTAGDAPEVLTSAFFGGTSSAYAEAAIDANAAAGSDNSRPVSTAIEQSVQQDADCEQGGAPAEALSSTFQTHFTEALISLWNSTEVRLGDYCILCRL